MDNFKYAPIVIFTYNRYEHFVKVIENLKLCDLANQSDLFIYSDGAKTEIEQDIVQKIRVYVKKIEGFKSVTLVAQNENYGLAKNIIEGVTKIVNEYEKIIVLEDDLIVSNQFLKYMNISLENFKDEKRIWHISGWNYPIDTINLPYLIQIRIMNCWGWATWKDRWNYFEKDPKKLINEFNKDMIKAFDVDNSGVFWNQIIANNNGLINTWAIFWYATIFLNNGICINPKISMVKNIGHDGSGTHKSIANKTYTTNNEIFNFNEIDFKIHNVCENELAIQRIKEFYKKNRPSFISRLKNKFLKIWGANK